VIEDVSDDTTAIDLIPAAMLTSFGVPIGVVAVKRSAILRDFGHAAPLFA